MKLGSIRQKILDSVEEIQQLKIQDAPEKSSDPEEVSPVVYLTNENIYFQARCWPTRRGALCNCVAKRPGPNYGKPGIYSGSSCGEGGFHRLVPLDSSLRNCVFFFSRLLRMLYAHQVNG
ncbi:MAG TPA: hypothetical protein VGR96_08075 [Acidobacteriaceae bacterium]|nr:hypothetical protein [Acidobacteriaceae bacterium]